MKKTAYILTLGLIAAGSLLATARTTNVNDIKHTITDNDIIYPESYELDTQKMLEGWYMRNYTATDDRYKRQGDVAVDDATMRARLAKLPTIIEMPYNSIVRNYIERYTSRGRSQVAALLGLSIYYMPIFEQALEEQGLPLELRYLPIVESGLDPNAVSKHGAAGLWQFMIGTGKGLGLEVSSLVDERRDPYLSSRTAAKYLKDLYNTYGDWSLAIAAYNCGPGNVNKAIRRAGGNPSDHDFWSIYNYLSPETRGYVPQFIAANYVMTYYPEHNISPVLPTKPLVTDTIMVSDRVHLQQISHVLNIPMEELRVLNPQFRADIIPGNPSRAYTLVLPSQQTHAYLMSEADIRNYEADKYTRRISVEPGDEPGASIVEEAAMESDADNMPALAEQTEQTEQVSRTPAGEPAQSYAVARGRRARSNQPPAPAYTAQDNTPAAETAPTPRQKKKTSSATASTSGSKSTGKSASKTKNKSKKKQSTQPTSHSVRSGDNLSNIAKRYGTTVEAIKKANNIKGSGDEIHPGDNIKLPSSAKVSSGKASSKSKAKSGSKSKSKSKSSSKSKKKKRR